MKVLRYSVCFKLDVWMDGVSLKTGRKEGWIDGCMNGWMHGWMDKCKF